MQNVINIIQTQNKFLSVHIAGHVSKRTMYYVTRLFHKFLGSRATASERAMVRAIVSAQFKLYYFVDMK